MDQLDFFGNVLSIGDEVASTLPYYHQISLFKIVKFTPKGCKVICISNDVMSKYVNEYGVMVNTEVQELSIKIDNLVKEYIRGMYANGDTIIDSILVVDYIKMGIDVVGVGERVKKGLEMRKSAS